MTNRRVLEDIIDELNGLLVGAHDRHIKAAIEANLIKYKKQLEDILIKNALDVIEYKIKHLTDKL